MESLNRGNFIKETSRNTRTPGVVIQSFTCASCGELFASDATSGGAYLTDSATRRAFTHLEETHPVIFKRPLYGMGWVEDAVSILEVVA